MSYNGSGTFLINTAGQPVVSGTVISSTAFNALTADLATGLSTAITKDGQTTPTANIPMGNNKITGLAAGTAATDAANLSQVQSTAVKLINSISGADTITGTLSPTLTAYAAGQMFYFVAAGDNTGAVTLNINSLGAKSVTRDGTTALIAGDIKSGEVCVVVYDGTQFQLVNAANSFGNLNVTGNLTLSGGTANGVLYLNGSKVATSGSALVFDGTNLGIGTSSPGSRLDVVGASAGSTVATLTAQSSSTDTNLLVFQRNDAAVKGVLKYYQSDAARPMLFGLETNHPLGFITNNTEGMRLTSTGLGIGTTSPGYKLDVRGVTASGNGTITTGFTYDTRGLVGTFSNHALGFITNGTSPTMVLDTSGNLGVGTNSPSRKLDVQVASDGIAASFGRDSGTMQPRLVVKASEAASTVAIGTDYAGATSPAIVFETAVTERARIDSLGRFMVGATDSSTSDTVAGVYLFPVGVVQGTRASNASGDFGRLVDDGDIVVFRQAGITEGSISVSGNTISYNAFAGSHWSQLQDGSKPDILRGTVMESINELCVWPGEQNERLPKSKISDTAGSKKVYGVFMAWDNDWTDTNDMYVTAVGAFICRVNASVTVQEGDLLESNGDGTARVQADDIIRSSTIGKVTSTVKTHEYDDGSYCVPAVLYCG